MTETMDDRRGASEKFLDQVGKHFVFLTGHFRPASGGPSTLMHASCFVVDIEGHWFLVTAGHVINGIRARVEGGYVFEDWMLQDTSAGNSFEFGIPYPYEHDHWIVLDESSGLDYAATAIPELIVRNMEAGKVKPISEIAWQPIPVNECRDWLVVGIPTEAVAVTETERLNISLAMVILSPTDPPREAGSEAKNRFYGKVTGTAVKDFDGMSGGPVFGTRVVDGALKYWVIGLQVSWFDGQRVVSFCPTSLFFSAVKGAVLKGLGEAASQDS